MEIFKQLKKLGYKHYVDLTIEELDTIPIDNIEKRIEYSLVIDWFRKEHDIDIVITPDSNSGHRIPTRKYFMTIWKYYNGLNVQPEILRHDNKILYFVNPDKAREQAILKCIEVCKKN